MSAPASERPPPDDNPGVPMAPPLFFVIPYAVTLAVEWFWPTSFAGSPLRWYAGAALVAMGAGLALWGYQTQVQAGTDPIPFHPTTKIVSRGPYGFTRNPMYVGFALITAGLACAADSSWALLAVPVGLVLVDRLVVVREERYLERKFGEEYVAYKTRVGRWL